MAEIQQNDSGKGKKKGHQKKMTIRVDFTPMVDMNMLLITFFMLCTTMIKSQTLSLVLPTNEKVENIDNQNQAQTQNAITLIIDAKRIPGTMQIDSVNGKVINEVYYYFGKPIDGMPESPENVAKFNNLQKAELLADEIDNVGNHKARGIRAIIQKRNENMYNAVKALKEKYNNGGFGSLETKADREAAQQKFNAERRKLIDTENHDDRPVFIIKPSLESSYTGLVQVLDEMQINSVSVYQIDTITPLDEMMLKDYILHRNK